MKKQRSIVCSQNSPEHLLSGLSSLTMGVLIEMLVKAAQAQYRIVELPIHYRHRSHGRSKVAGTFAGSIKAAYYMVQTTVRYAGARRRDV